VARSRGSGGIRYRLQSRHTVRTRISTIITIGPSLTGPRGTQLTGSIIYTLVTDREAQIELCYSAGLNSSEMSTRRPHPPDWPETRSGLCPARSFPLELLSSFSAHRLPFLHPEASSRRAPMIFLLGFFFREQGENREQIWEWLTLYMRWYFPINTTNFGGTN
jgi:hypothetical protein